MASYAAFLRGVNLGPVRKVSSPELRSIFERMGFAGVATFRTSGNVVFDAERPPSVEDVESSLAKALGYEVAVFLRSEPEMRAIAAHEPFPHELIEASSGKLQVSLLPSKPTKRVRDEVLAVATDDDRLAFGDRELYWLPSGGIRDSALGMRRIEQLVGPSTMRTKGTLDLIAERYFAS
jgi:uncharacterized protein (DUF1697 family)